MSFRGAFARCRAVMGPGKEVGEAFEIWAKKKMPAEGEITMHLSPNEINSFWPWIKTFPKKVQDRAPGYIWPIGTVSAIYLTYKYGDQAVFEDEKKHRD